MTRLRKELRDQSAHAAAAIVILLPLALAPSIVTGAIAGLGLGLARELAEEGKVTLEALRHCFTGPHSRLDVAFWAIGGALVGTIAGAFA